MDYMKSPMLLVCWCIFHFVCIASQSASTNRLLTRNINDENWYVSQGNSLQNGKINQMSFQTEPIHDIYTIKGSDGEVRRVHYAVDEHGLRANIHSNTLGLGTNTETISIQSEPRRWPSDDFDFGLDEFISMRQTEHTAASPNFVQMALDKPSILSQDISEEVPQKDLKFSPASANLPASIYSKRLFTKLVPTDPQQFPHTGKALTEKISYGTNARNENLNKYRTPSAVSSPNYLPSSKIYPTNNFFESQRIVKPFIQPYSIPILSLDSFSKNGSRNLDTNTEIQKDGNTSHSEMPKSALNLEDFPTFGTTTNLSENEEYVVFKNAKKESSISDPTRDYNQTEYSDAYTKSNSSKPILFIPVSNDSIPIIEIKTQTEPNFSNSLTSKPFGLVPLSTIFDLDSDEGGPYYHYVMNMGKNSGDTVSELIEKYFGLDNPNKLINDTNDNISSKSTVNTIENNKGYPGYTENTNTGLKINEHIFISNEIKNSPSDSIINASLNVIDSENYSKNTSQIDSTKIISRGVSIQNLSAVNEEIMRIVNDQRVISPAVTEGKLTGVDNVLNVLPIQQIKIEEVMNSTATTNDSFNQAVNSPEENIQKNTDNYAEIRIQPELLNNTSKGVINVETTYSPNLKFPDRNLKGLEANNSKLTDNIFTFMPGFTNSTETTPAIMHLEQHSAAILKLQNGERNATSTNTTEAFLFNALNSNADSLQVSSSDILGKSDEKNSTDSNTYYPDKSIIRILANLNLLSPADEVIAHNGIQTYNSNLKEGRNLNTQMRHPMLELMIPKAKMNDFMMKINNTPVILRILHPEILASETIPYIFKFQDGDGSFSDKDIDSNYNSNLSDNFSNILNLLQPNVLKYNKDSTSTSTSKTAEIDSLNNAINQSVVPMANNNEMTTTFPTEALTSDSLDEKSSLKDTSLVQEKYETIAKLDTDSSVTYPVVQESKIVESANIDRYNSKQFLNLHLFNNSETQHIDKNEAENKSKNKFYSYVANIIHNSDFPEKDRYKSRTKVQPLDFNGFYKLIYKNQKNGVPNGYEIVQNIANKLDTEDFQSQNFDIKDFLTGTDLNNARSVPNQDIRINNSDDLPSSVQYAVIPYEGFEYSDKV